MHVCKFMYFPRTTQQKTLQIAAAALIIIHLAMTDACLFVTRQECQDWLRPAAKKSSGPTASNSAPHTQTRDYYY